MEKFQLSSRPQLWSSLLAFLAFHRRENSLNALRGVHKRVMAKNMGFVDFSFLLKPQGVRRNGHKNIQFISRHAVIGIQMGQAALFILLSALGPDGPG